jgi:hypothetical protein
MPGGMAAGPLTWQEVAAWQQRMSLDLQPWESRLIVFLSRAYASEQSQADDEDRAPPWRDTWRASAKREAIAKAIKAQLSSSAHSESAAPAATKRKRRKP